MTRRMLLTLASAALAPAVLALAACSGSVSVGKSVDPDDIVKQINEQLVPQLPATPDSVDCPDSLKAEVDATTTCTVTIDGTRYVVDVKATSVDGDKVSFDLDMSGETTE